MQKKFHNRTGRVAVLGVGGAGMAVTRQLVGATRKPVRLGGLDQGEALALMMQGMDYFQSDGTDGNAACAGARQCTQGLTAYTKEELGAWFHGSELAIVIAGLGGEAAMQATLEACHEANGSGAFTVLYFIEPFAFELGKHDAPVQKFIRLGREECDAMLLISNERVWEIFDRDISFREAIAKVNDMAAESIQGLMQTMEGCRGVGWDFRDLVKVCAKEHSLGSIGVGRASRREGVERAFREALAKAFIQSKRLSSTKLVLVQVSAGPDLTLADVEEACQAVRSLGADTECRFSIRWLDELRDAYAVKLFFFGIDSEVLHPAMQTRGTECDHAARGIFSQDSPNCHGKDDLDVPTFLRQGVKIRV